ncbi:hypothetical protein HZU72_20450 [Halomonas sp. QX-2]|jgi:hypothetical protein|uniref:Uncharacterized protein n=1 Tax=Vreelandella sedimenti TaxID=2729618 RepID=A0A7Z0SQA9_9GAMM|nr:MULTISPECIES: hypothetical protein [Halomonas]NYT74766.1 hypothetical protein [Halomonas sedimenti]|tara:strand:+ start:19360 stop:19716 length:357 start_codon:yes stop_codon:yes gene_type:complete
MSITMQRLHLTHPLHFVIGLTLWCIWFVAVYGGHAIACSVAPPAPEQGVFTLVNAMLLVVSIAAIALLAVLTVGCCRMAKRHEGRLRFNATVSAGLYLFSTLGVVFAAMPIIGIPPCL